MSKKPRAEFIVKVQRPLMPPDATECLIYNQDHSLRVVIDLADLPEIVRKVLATEARGFFLVASSSSASGAFTVLDEAPAQPW